MKITLSGILKKTTCILGAFLVIVLLVTCVFWWKLGQGINIDHLDPGPATVSNLFLQYDQGLIVRSEEIKIKDTTSSKKHTDLDSIVPHIKKWGHLVREISIQRLIYNNQAAGIAYRNGNFHVQGDNYVIEAAIRHAQNTFHVELARLEIIPYKITLTGKASYSRVNNLSLFSGAFETPWVNGSLSISEQDRNVAVEISSERFTDLGIVLKQFPIDEDTVNWVAYNISAHQYQVKKLDIQFSLKDLGNFGPDNISGSAVADSASIRFHDDLEPVQCEQVHISYADDRLSFAMDKPIYKDKNLDGSSVYIDNLIKGDSQLVININTESKNDRTIDEILGKFGLYNLANQESGLTRAYLELIFTLPGFDLSTRGTFTTGPGEWTIEGIPLHTETAKVLLHNNIITIEQANIAFMDILQGNISGEIDLETMQADMQIDLDSLNMKAGNITIIEASELKTPVKVDFATIPILISFPELDTTLSLDKGNRTINIENLKAISPIVPLLRNLQFTEGNLHVESEDMVRFEFNGTIKIPNDYFSRKNAPVNTFNFTGTFQPGKTTIALNGSSITASITDKIYVNLHDNLVTVDTNSVSTDDTPELPLPLYLRGDASRIRLKKDELITQNFQLTLNDSDLDFIADLEKGKIHFRHDPDGISFTGKDLDARLVENFMQSADLEDGTLNISLLGDQDGYNGYLEITNVLFKDYLVMNNVFAFLNAIPALATFSSTGFDNEGYRINEAVILFDIQDKLLTIRQLRADGITVDCEAHGWIDFKGRTLNIKLKLITLKDYSKILDTIPLVGYAMLGKDGKLSTSLDIKGSLDDPAIETYLTEDILMTPYKIIKRTIKWPFKVFDDLTN